MDLSRYAAADDRPLLRIDGRVKTVVFLAAVVVAATLTNWLLALAVWSMAATLFFALRFRVRDLLLRLLAPLGIAWLVFLSALFTHGRHPLFVVHFKLFALTAWREGATQGALLFLRIMASVTFATLLAFSTPMIEILETLRRCKVPGAIIDIADLMYRYIFIVQRTAHTMRCAQLSRLGDTGSWIHRAADTGCIASSILIQSLDRSTRIYHAMLARGYCEDAANMQFFPCPIPKRDKLLGWASGAVLLLFGIANVCWG